MFNFTHLAPSGRYDEISVNIFFAELFGNVQTERTVIVINVPLRWIAEYSVGPVDLFEFLCGFRVVWVFIRMIFQCESPVSFFYVF